MPTEEAPAGSIPALDAVGGGWRSNPSRRRRNAAAVGRADALLSGTTQPWVSLCSADERLSWSCGRAGSGKCVSEAVCTPSSVTTACAVADGHPSEAAGYPTALAADPRAGQRTSPPSSCLDGLRPPIWPCSGWSLPRFTPSTACAAAGIVTVALVLVSRRTGVTRHPALRSSDVPHAANGVAPDRRAAIRPPR